MKVKKYVLPLVLAIYSMGCFAATKWVFLNGPSGLFNSPDEACAALGSEPLYPIGPRGQWGCWGNCRIDQLKCYYPTEPRSCDVGSRYNDPLGTCEEMDTPPRAPGVTDIPPQDNCISDDLIDNSGQCNAMADTNGCNDPLVGNPILISTGQKVEFETDLSISATSLNFARNYWSSRKSISNMGMGWQYNWRMHIDQLTYKNQVKLYRNDGTGYIFTPLGNGQWKAPVGVRIAMTSLPDGGWKVISPEGAVEIYNTVGKLISYTEMGNSTITLLYNAIGQLINLADTSGKSLTITYNGNGLITKVISSTGLSVSYSYDTKKRLISITKNSKTKKYHYENTQYPNALTGITDERGIRYVTWQYNDKGQAISSENINGLNKYQLEFLDNKKTKVINPLGQITIYHFDYFLRKPKVIKVEGQAIGSCIATNSSYYYNYQGLLQSKVNKNGNATNYEYNNRGLEILSNFGGSNGAYVRKDTIWHDTLPLPISIKKGNNRTTFEYDNNGRLINQTVHSN